MFVFENDSTDGTAEALDGHALRNDWFHVQHDTWGGIDSRGFEKERTERLAKARNICMEWVRENGSDNYYTIVLDLDPDYGFSPEGVLNSIGWMGDSFVQAGAMASYSLYKVKAEDGNIALAQYDSWAARLNWWRDRRDDPGGMGWFSLLMPPVGSPPIPMNSAFGGLCVYRTEAFLTGGYSGEDCEHVPHHRRMAAAGHRLCLNPGCRYIAVWQ
jgi:glycosyltransferase involved in cell wall biosynthesis